jgi:hypothetical protein
VINQIRYQQQYQQIYRRIEPGAGTVVTYGTRDAVTGLRTVRTADGGIRTAQYLSNSIPNQVIALSQSSTIGLTGYISQKPY